MACRPSRRRTACAPCPSQGHDSRDPSALRDSDDRPGARAGERFSAWLRGHAARGIDRGAAPGDSGCQPASDGRAAGWLRPAVSRLDSCAWVSGSALPLRWCAPPGGSSGGARSRSGTGLPTLEVLAWIELGVGSLPAIYRAFRRLGLRRRCLRLRPPDDRRATLGMFPCVLRHSRRTPVALLRRRAITVARRRFVGARRGQCSRWLSHSETSISRYHSRRRSLRDASAAFATPARHLAGRRLRVGKVLLRPLRGQTWNR